MEIVKDTVKKVKTKRFSIKKKLAKNSTRVNAKAKLARGVLYVKHIPHGFYEPQIKRYFEQFGHVTRIRLSRSKRTGRSKGYAYVEFSDEAVARITADAMKDYLMFRHRMMCFYVPRNRAHRDIFKKWNIPFKRPIAHLLAMKRHNKVHADPKKELKRSSKALKRNEKSLEKIKALGVEYDLD